MKALTKKAVDKNLAKAAEKEHSPAVSASTTAAKKLDTPVNTVVKKAEEKQAAAAVKRQAKKLGLSPSQVCQHKFAACHKGEGLLHHPCSLHILMAPLRLDFKAKPFDLADRAPIAQYSRPHTDMSKQ